MKRTLKRESKVFEIVESDAFVVSVCLIFGFFLNLLLVISFFAGNFRLSQVENGGLTPVTKMNLSNKTKTICFEHGHSISASQDFFFGMHCYACV
jgi:hypothetical protein